MSEKSFPQSESPTLRYLLLSFGCRSPLRRPHSDKISHKLGFAALTKSLFQTRSGTVNNIWWKLSVLRFLPHYHIGQCTCIAGFEREDASETIANANDVIPWIACYDSCLNDCCFRRTCYITDRTKSLDLQGVRTCLFLNKIYGRKYDERGSPGTGIYFLKCRISNLIFSLCRMLSSECGGMLHKKTWMPILQQKIAMRIIQVF